MPSVMETRVSILILFHRVVLHLQKLIKITLHVLKWNNLDNNYLRI